MADFTAEVRRYMTERGLSLRQLARAASYDASYLSKVLTGQKPYSPYLAARLDDVLGAGGHVREAASQPPRRSAAGRTRSKSAARPSRVVAALQATLGGGTAGLDIAADSLADLIPHYSHAVSATASAQVYDELLSVRSFAAELLDRDSLSRYGVAVTAGWLSGLLAVSATDLGDHATALVWCSDTARRGRDAGLPELEAWATLTRAMIAYYRGDAPRSAALARRGQQIAPPGTVVHARLAAHEMRSLAAMGDADGMALAMRSAAAAIGQLPAGAPNAGVFSISLAEDPPYTATSLLLVHRYAEAASATRRVIEAAYRGVPGDQPAKYARTLLILGLAEAGVGRVDAAAAAGRAALDHGPPAWTTMVLAGKLDTYLASTYPGSAEAASYRASYAGASARADRPAGRLGTTAGSSGER